MKENKISVFNGKVLSLIDNSNTSSAWGNPFESGDVVVQVGTPIPPKNWHLLPKIVPLEFLKVKNKGSESKQPKPLNKKD